MTSINEVLTFPVQRLADDAIIPARNHPADAGFDLYAVEDVTVRPGETVIVKTGIAIALTEGFELQVRPRSGNSFKTKIRVANSPGTVDANYRGEIGVIIDNITNPLYELSAQVMKNLTQNNPIELVWAEAYQDAMEKGTYTVRKGDRIAQAVIAHVPQTSLIEADSLDETDRGSKGFGSSGV